MGNLIFWTCALAIAAFLGYKTGKWSKEWEMVMLQNDNTKLIGEVHRLEREIYRSNIQFVGEVFTKNNIKEQEEQLWD